MVENTTRSFDWEQRARKGIVELETFPEYELVTTASIRKLKKLLIKNDVWTDEWTSHDLIKIMGEIRKGERLLIMYRSNPGEPKKLALLMEIISADVLFKGKDCLYRLREQLQSVTSVTVNRLTGKPISGESKATERIKPAAVSEKMIVGTTPGDAIHRAMQEELSMHDSNLYECDHVATTNEARRNSLGMMTLTRVHRFTVVIRDDQAVNPPFDEHTESEQLIEGRFWSFKKTYITKLIRFVFERAEVESTKVD